MSGAHWSLRKPLLLSKLTGSYSAAADYHDLGLWKDPEVLLDAWLSEAGFSGGLMIKMYGYAGAMGAYQPAVYCAT